MGTSAMKVALVDADSKIIRQSRQTYRISQPKPGFKEIDSEIWWKAALDGIDEVLSQGHGPLVSGIGVTGQMHTTVFFDEAGKSLRPAIMWNDTRTFESVQRLRDALGDAPDGKAIRHILSTGSPAANLHWVKEMEPKVYAALKHFLIGPDYLVHRLAGGWGSDYCEASTSSLYDIEGKRWSPSMARLLDLPAACYPTLHHSAEPVGTLQQELGDALGMEPDVFVVTGSGDNVAAALATGCLTDGFPVLSLGTSGVLMTARPHPDFSAKGKNILYALGDRHFGYLVQGVVQSAGSSYDWLVERILEDCSSGVTYHNANPGELGGGSLLFYPHLVGDKTLYKDSELRGAIFGIGTDTSREDLVLAVMEGIAFAVRELSEAMDIHPECLRVTGGGTKSDLWMQIFSDVLGIEIQPMTGGGSAVVGAAQLAMMADGGVIKTEPKGGKCFTPKADNVRRYALKYQKYLKIHTAVKAVYQ